MNSRNVTIGDARLRANMLVLLALLVGCTASGETSRSVCGFGTWDYERRAITGIEFYSVDRVSFVQTVLPGLREGHSFSDAVPLGVHSPPSEWPLVTEETRPWVSGLRARDWLACNVAEAIGEPFWVDTYAPTSVREERISRLVDAAERWLIDGKDVTLSLPSRCAGTQVGWLMSCRLPGIALDRA